jgi:hypothetical protein
VKTDLVCSVAVLSICVGYGVAAWLLWRYQVAAPRDWLLARLNDTHVRIDTEKPWAAGPGAQDNLKWLGEWIDKRRIFLPPSRVQSVWRHVHSIEDAHVLELPDHVVDERLSMARYPPGRAPSGSRSKGPCGAHQKYEGSLVRPDASRPPVCQRLSPQSQQHVRGPRRAARESRLAHARRPCARRGACLPVRPGELLPARGCRCTHQPAHARPHATSECIRLRGGFLHADA